MPILPKAIHRFSVIPINIPPRFFTGLERTIFSFIWKHKKPRIGKTIMKNKELQEVSPSQTLSYTTELQ